MEPVRLRPNLIDHFYVGGARIAALRGIATTSERQPEEWIAATVAREGSDTQGLATTEGGHLLRDLVAADSSAWTGAPGAWPGDTRLLLKLLDAGQRLPVHVHPDRAFAASHLDCAYGKTEAWFVLDAEPGAAVHVGWADDVTPADVVRARDEQDSGWLLSHMNRVPVHRGDAVLIPAGTVHAIGAGILVAEVQEPTDFSILLEWSVTTSSRGESHLGLGFDLAMSAVEHAATTPARLSELVVHHDIEGPSAALFSLLPPEADPYFTLHLASRGAHLEPGFAAAVVLGGSGDLEVGSARLHVAHGDVLAVPYAAGAWAVDGDVRVLIARPGSARCP